MQILRAHHFKQVMRFIEKAHLSKKWSKDSTIPIESFIRNEVESSYQIQAQGFKQTLQRGSQYPDEVESAIQYIGPNGENEENFFNLSTEYFISICNFIISEEGILRIQTDPSLACEACWLANNRKFGLHCIQDPNTPLEERNHYFPLEDDDVLHLEVLSNILSIPIAEAPGVTSGVVNKYLDIRADILRELLISNGEFNRDIVREIADQLRDKYESIGMMNFDWIYYVFNQRA